MWYVIWTLTGKEEQCKKLINKYCDPATYDRCVVAMVQKKKRDGGVWVTKTEKFAPSYLFLESGNIAEFAEGISKIIGFHALLKNDELYLPLHEREVELLERLLQDGDVIKESFGYKEGQNITITEGPLKGLEGMIKYIDRHKRIAVLEMDMFGRTLEMKLALEVM